MAVQKTDRRDRFSPRKFLHVFFEWPVDLTAINVPLIAFAHDQCL